MDNMPKPLSGSNLPTLVVRTDVGVRSHYSDYREELRYDFFFSCAYCTIMESEAAGFSFQIDHYVPQSVDGAERHTYSNLMWSCDSCNRKKGAIVLPKEAIASGFRFFKADTDDFFAHFRLNGEALEWITPVGEFTSTILYLNRPALKQVRNLRMRAATALPSVAAGVHALRRLPIDQVPTFNRGEVAAIRARALKATEDVQRRLDELIREIAKSTLIDPDPNKLADNSQRRELLNRLGALGKGARAAV